MRDASTTHDMASEASRTRLSAQCATMLAMLTRGPVTNADLATISLKYTSRVSDLRAAGIKIECYDLNRKTGLSWYRLGAETA